MKGKLPVSKAKTAYGLLSEIAALAIEEPKRMRMGVFLVTKTGPEWRDVAPECGTLGCIAGWTSVLANAHTPEGDVSYEARQVLGLSSFQSSDLFLDSSLCSDDGQGTARHARKVVAHIRRFQKKYRTQLLAKKLGAK